MMRYPHIQLPGTGHDTSGKIYQIKPNGLQSFWFPFFRKNETFHEAVKVESEDHDPPPGGIDAKGIGREHTPRKILLHDGMGLFALAATLMMPGD